LHGNRGQRIEIFALSEVVAKVMAIYDTAVKSLEFIMANGATYKYGKIQREWNLAERDC